VTRKCFEEFVDQRVIKNEWIKRTKYKLFNLYTQIVGITSMYVG
jgi:hypothetical protein